MSQQDHILAFLRAGGRLTPKEALSRFGCFRLAARIYDLKAEGHDIQERMVVVPGKDGTTCLVAEYSMSEPEELFARPFRWDE